MVVAGDWYVVPYLGDAPDWITVTAAYVGVFALSVLVANIVYLPIRFWRRLKSRKQKAAHADRVRQEILSAPPEELAILAYLITSGRKAFAAEFNDRRLAPLVSKGIITKLGGTNSVLEWPYIVNSDAWEFLLENKDQLVVPNVDSMGDPFHWRSSGW